MAVNFPASLDSLTNPTSSSSVANPSHAQQHSDANDAIEALEAKVGIDGSAVVTSHDYKISQLQSLVTSAVAGAKSIYQDVRNQSGSAFSKATPVYISGSTGASGQMLISAASNPAESTSSKTMGLTTSAIANNSNGQVISEGILEGIDTTGAADGDPVWLGTNGAKIYGLVNKPSAPAHLVFLGIVIRGGQSNTGSMYVKIQNGFELEELHNVQISSLVNGNILAYDSTTQTWKNTNTLQSTSSTVPLVVKAASSQSANLQEWQDSAGAVKMSINQYGSIVASAGGTYISSNGDALFGARNATTIPLIVKAAASQTANLQEWQDSAGSVLAKVASDGTIVAYGSNLNAFHSIGTSATGYNGITVQNNSNGSSFVLGTAGASESLFSVANSFYIYDGIAGLMRLRINSSGLVGINAVPTAQLQVNNSTAGNVGLIVKGASSQTANLQEWQTSNGTVVSYLTTFSSTNNSAHLVLGGADFKVGSNELYFGRSGSTSYISHPTSFTIYSIYGGSVIVKGSASQTADLQQWHSNSGTVLAQITSNGQIISNSLGINGSSSGISYVRFSNAGGDTSATTFVIRAVTSQTGDLQQWQNSSGSVLANVSNNGAFGIQYVQVLNTVGANIAGGESQIRVISPDNTKDIRFWNRNDAGGMYYYNSSGGSKNILRIAHSTDPRVVTQTWQDFTSGNSANYGGRVNIDTSATTTVGLVIRGLASQTANLQEWQNSAGTVLAKVNSSGSLFVQPNSANNITMLTVNDTNNNILTFSSDSLNRTSFTVKSNLSESVYGGAYFTADGAQESWLNMNTRNNTSGQRFMRFGNLSNKFSVQLLNDAATSITSTPFILENSSPTNSLYIATNGIAINGSSPLGQLSVVSSSASTVGLAVRGAASQTADLQQWQNSAGTVLASVDAYGTLLSNWKAYIQSGASYLIPLVVKGATSQSANLQEWQNSAGTTQAFVKVNGSINARYLDSTGSSGTFLDVQSGSMGFIGRDTVSTTIFARAAASQTADIQQWQNSSGTVLAKVDTNGSITAGANLIVGNAAMFYTGGNYYNSTISVLTQGAGYSGIVVRGQASQTANLQEWQDSAGTVLAGIGPNGRIYAQGKSGNTDDLLYLRRADNNVYLYVDKDAVLRGNFTIRLNQDSPIDTQAYIYSGTGSRSALGVSGTSSINPTFYVKAVASQTSDLQQWQDSAGSVLAKIDASGSISAVDLTLSGNLTVNGTTTNLNSTNLVIEDKNIIIADVATPTDTTADGAGITIKGATDKTFNWVQSTKSFTSSDAVNINSASASTPPLIIKHASSPTSSYFEIKNSAGVNVWGINSVGEALTKTTTKFGANIQNDSNNNSNALTVSGQSDGTGIALYVYSGSTSKDIAKFDSNGIVKLSITSDGSLKGGNSSTISVNTASTVDTVALSSFTSIEYTLSIKQGSKIRSSKVLVHTDGTSVDSTEYSIMEMGGGISGILVTASASGTDAILQVTITDAATTNATVKLIKTML